MTVVVSGRRRGVGEGISPGVISRLPLCRRPRLARVGFPEFLKYWMFDKGYM